jgi:21S rRNA (GM2251-2'-O)-methyltransferase
MHLTSLTSTMLNTILPRSARISAGTCITSYRSYHAGRGGSVNTAIERGLRKSKGMGFRGKAIVPPGDPREKYRTRHGIEAYTSPQHDGDSGQQRQRSNVNKSSRSGDSRPRSQQRLERGPADLQLEEPERRGRYGEIVRGATLRKIEYKEKPRDRGRPAQRREDRTGKRESPYSQDNQESQGYRPDARKYSRSPSASWDRPIETRSFGARSTNTNSERYDGSASANQGSEALREVKVLGSSDRYGASRAGGGAVVSQIKPRITQTIDNRIPISIPYTTPSSEFLYGTSVVEAALSSRKEPRRKLYKLYIYSGADREDPSRDSRIIRLAQKNRVEVVHVDRVGVRMMDKMTGGRPHNGYVLEGTHKLLFSFIHEEICTNAHTASPLPKLPITSLGEIKTEDGRHGFEVFVDHQSREEAVVNGNDNFIPILNNHSKRNPLVLLLDSIVDPGNLGGIIRTAAFLGVSAVAISTRNSATFTPVVLKASAGASENVTLFSVKKPSGFIVDSQANGWKVFAAVAPPSKDHQSVAEVMSTNSLMDPLSEAPCILMLGSEGEGLRWNLRSKADVDLYIPGSGRSYNVDSLNVSVATGILCSSFLNNRDATKTSNQIPVAPEPTPELPDGRLF